MNSSEGCQFQGIQMWEGHTWPRASCPHLPIQYFTIICSNGDLNRTYSSGWHCATIASFIYFFYSYSIISLSRYPVTLKLPRQCQSIKEHNFICSQYFGRFVGVFTMRDFLLDSHETSAGCRRTVETQDAWSCLRHLPSSHLSSP